MAIIPTAALTTVQIVGGLAASAKNALDLSKASANHELKAVVSELYDSILDVKGRVLDLDEEVRRLKAELGRREEVVGPDLEHGYYFFKSKPEQPLCPKCFQSIPSNTSHLSPKRHVSGDVRRFCIVCGYQYWEERANPP